MTASVGNINTAASETSSAAWSWFIVTTQVTVEYFRCKCFPQLCSEFVPLSFSRSEAFYACRDQILRYFDHDSPVRFFLIWTLLRQTTGSNGILILIADPALGGRTWEEDGSCLESRKQLKGNWEKVRRKKMLYFIKLANILQLRGFSKLNFPITPVWCYSAQIERTNQTRCIRHRTWRRTVVGEQSHPLGRATVRHTNLPATSSRSRPESCSISELEQRPGHCPPHSARRHASSGVRRHRHLFNEPGAPPFPLPDVGSTRTPQMAASGRPRVETTASESHVAPEAAHREPEAVRWPPGQSCRVAPLAGRSGPSSAGRRQVGEGKRQVDGWPGGAVVCQAGRNAVVASGVVKRILWTVDWTLTGSFCLRTGIQIKSRRLSAATTDLTISCSSLAQVSTQALLLAEMAATLRRAQSSPSLASTGPPPPQSKSRQSATSPQFTSAEFSDSIAQHAATGGLLQHVDALAQKLTLEGMLMREVARLRDAWTASRSRSGQHRTLRGGVHGECANAMLVHSHVSYVLQVRRVSSVFDLWNKIFLSAMLIECIAVFRVVFSSCSLVMKKIFFCI